MVYEVMDYESKRRMINGLCNALTGYKLNNDFFGKWFIEAFPDEQNKGYITEWITRFMKGTPFIYMDIRLSRIYIIHIKAWNGITD